MRQLTFTLLVAFLAATSLHCGGTEESDDAGSAGAGGVGATGGGAAGSGGPGGSGATGGSGGTGGVGGSGGEGGAGAAGGAGGAGAAGGAGGTVGGTGGSGGVPVDDKFLTCQGSACQCSDGQDNDGDGLADEFDPECSGPYDNDESSFWTGIPGDNRGSNGSTECFFDGNSGPGNDANCADWTPNGCDCFGCCWIDVNGNGTAEQVGMFTPGCRTARDPEAAAGTEGGACRTSGAPCDAGLSCLEDGDGVTSFCTACGSCLQNTACINPCDDGENCVGEPPGGAGGAGGVGGSGGTGGSGGAGGSGGSGGTPEPICPGGRDSCVVHSDCPGASEFCVTGCCQVFQ